jgi:hypothetical protein
MKRSLLLPFLLAACGSQPASPTTARRPPPARARPRVASPRALPGYPPPEEPRAATCVLTGPWSPEEPHELRFRRGGRTFATVNHVTRAALSLGDDPGSPFAELSAPEARLWGVVVADQLLIHPARPLLLDGYLAPGPTAVLRWVGAAAEPVPIEVQLPEFIRPAAPPRDDVRCSDLSLDEPEFDPRAAIDAPAGQDMLLVEGKAIPLAREPAGPAAAELRFEDGGSPSIEVIERRGDRVRIVVHHSSLNPAENVLVVGWVASSALASRPAGFGGSWGSGGDATSALPRPREGWQMVTCPREVPLVVELERERHLVGAVAAGVRLELPPDADRAGDGLVEIAVRTRQIEFADDVRVLAKGSALAGCTAATAPER